MQDFSEFELSFYRMKVEEHFLKRYIRDVPFYAIKGVEDKMHSTIKDAFNMIEMQYQRELQEKIPGGEYKSVF